ncbi:MAG: hypothetical protein ABIA63_10090 [bacterium]
MTLLYLDHNCFQRGFDDINQLDETNLCPFQERKYEILRLSRLCTKRVGPNKNILENAIRFQRLYKTHSKDSLHIACAINAKARCFITCDDAILNKSKRFKNRIEIINPVEYVKKEILK